METEDDDEIGLDLPKVAPPEVWEEFEKQLDADAEKFRATVLKHCDRKDKAEAESAAKKDEAEEV